MSELARALANHERSFRALGDAFAAAARDPSCPTSPVVALERALVDRDMQVDGAAITDSLIALVALQSTKLGATPRQIWEQLWNEAPTDAWWRAATTKGDDR